MDTVYFVVKDCWRRTRLGKRNCFEFFIIRKEKTVFLVFISNKIGCVALEKRSKINNVWFRRVGMSGTGMKLSLMIRAIRRLMMLVVMLMLLRNMFNGGVNR